MAGSARDYDVAVKLLCLYAAQQHTLVSPVVCLCVCVCVCVCAGATLLRQLMGMPLLSAASTVQIKTYGGGGSTGSPILYFSFK